MSRLADLIRQLCPDGVPYKTLGEVAFYPKKRIAVNGLTSENYVGVDNLLKNKQGVLPSNYVPAEGMYFEFHADDILIGNIRPYLKKIWLATHSGGASGDVVLLRTKPEFSNLAPRFLYYLLSADSFFLYDMQYAKGAKMPRGDRNAILRYSIPVPPLPVQEEIVRILDAFTTLEAELEARRRQYEYYREKLLTFGDDVPRVKLEEVATAISSGKNKRRVGNGDFPVYGSTGIISTTNIAIYEGVQILVARVGANAGYTYLAQGKYDVSDNTLIVALHDNICQKFIFYVLKNMNLHQYAKGGGQPLITASQLKQIPIPLPPLSEQSRIVGILDRFDTLCNDLCKGLPAEIAARHRQYEYYRDKLLSFKEAKG